MKVFISHSERDKELVANLAGVLREYGHVVFIPSEMNQSANIFAEISASIRSANILIAVVTPGNPNIYYEMGLASGVSVPILVAAQPGEVLPADLASIPYVPLTGDVSRDAQVIALRTKELEGIAVTKETHFKSAEAALHAASKNPAMLESLNPYDFERLVAELFKERGYEVEVPSSSHEIGADFILKAKDEQELVVVEVKKLSRQSRVSVETVRQLLGAVTGVAGASLGMLVSTSGFTAAAFALAAGTPLILRTLEEVLAAKSEKDLFKSKPQNTK
jgi:hypothetical protein